MKELPEYVKMDELVLRHIGDGYYHRDAGAWTVNSKIKNGVLMTKTRRRYMNNVPLVETTKKEWEKDNGKYAR